MKNKNLINWTRTPYYPYSINNTIFHNSKAYTDRPSDSKRNFPRETRSKTRDLIIRAAGAPDRSHQYLGKIWISHLFPANATLVFARSIVRAPLTPPQPPPSCFSTLSFPWPPSLLPAVSPLVLLSLSPSLSLTRREDYWISCHFQKKYALFTLPCYEHASTRPGCGWRNKKYTRSGNEPSPSLTYVLAKSTTRYFVAITLSLSLSWERISCVQIHRASLESICLLRLVILVRMKSGIIFLEMFQLGKERSERCCIWWRGWYFCQ